MRSGARVRPAPSPLRPVLALEDRSLPSTLSVLPTGLLDGLPTGLLAVPAVVTESPASRGLALGEVVPGWTQGGMHGPQLADMIHQYQAEHRGLAGDPPAITPSSRSADTGSRTEATPAAARNDTPGSEPAVTTPSMGVVGQSTFASSSPPARAVATTPGQANTTGVTAIPAAVTLNTAIGPIAAVAAATGLSFAGTSAEPTAFMGFAAAELPATGGVIRYTEVFTSTLLYGGVGNTPGVPEFGAPNPAPADAVAQPATSPVSPQTAVSPLVLSDDTGRVLADFLAAALPAPLAPMGESIISELDAAADESGLGQLGGLIRDWAGSESGREWLPWLGVLGIMGFAGEIARRQVKKPARARHHRAGRRNRGPHAA